MANSTVPMDRLTTLPEDMKRNIISRLQAPDAVRLSIVSREWRRSHLCSSLENLIFEEDHFPNIDRKLERFTEFIGQTLAYRVTNSDIKMLCIKFRLCDPAAPCPPLNPADLIALIAFAVEHNVESLDLSLRIHHDRRRCQCLFTCPSLKYFRLETPYQCLELPVSVCLPNLIDLTLCAVVLPYEGMMQHLLSGCPLLERLVIKRCIVEHNLCFSTVVGWLPRLKHLEIVGCVTVERRTDSFQLSFHSLPPCDGLISLAAEISDHYQICKSPAGDINLAVDVFCDAKWNRDYDRLASSLSGLVAGPPQDARTFDAKFFFARVLRKTFARRMSEVFYARNLQQLYVLMWPTKSHVEKSLTLLAEMPHLKELHINITGKGLGPRHLELPVRESDLFVFLGANNVLNNLKQIHIYNFEGLENEILMVKHLLRTATSLIEMQVEIKTVIDEEGRGLIEPLPPTCTKFMAIAQKLLCREGCMQGRWLICSETRQLVYKRNLDLQVKNLNLQAKRARLW